MSFDGHVRIVYISYSCTMQGALVVQRIVRCKIATFVLNSIFSAGHDCSFLSIGFHFVIDSMATLTQNKMTLFHTKADGERNVIWQHINNLIL